MLGVIYLKDVVKEGMRSASTQLRAMGIRTIMVTGDNRLTAAKIAEEAGVDDFLAEATPERKLELIKEQQADGRLIAMTGDGTNDAPALAQADVGVAMNTGTQAAREAGNMVDLDSNPTKLIEIVEVGKQLLITRGALTTFSIANDVAKYFAILPAMFATTYAARGPAKGRSTRSTSCPWGRRVGDPLSGHLQRADHPPADPALAARGPLPADRRHRAAAPQHADLRARRPDRPLHRDQADRPDRPQPPRGMRWPAQVSYARPATPVNGRPPARPAPLASPLLRLRRSSLDLALAAGAEERESAALAAACLPTGWLTGSRRRLADALAGLRRCGPDLCRPELGRRPGSRRGPLRANEISHSRSGCLRCGQPIDPSGAALLRLLLIDPAGPLYSTYDTEEPSKPISVPRRCT